MATFYKKQFGQNFLQNREAAKKLVTTADICREDTVLEVGAGAGMVTQYLVPKAEKVIAVEIDPRFVKLLKTRFVEDKNIEIVNEDILKIKVRRLKLVAGKYKVIGSLPYNISKKIIRKFLEDTVAPESITVIIQKEVAEDYVAKPPKATFLSNYAQIFSKVELGVVISKEHFKPIPKVDGAIIKFKTQISKFKIKKKSEFIRFIKTGFLHPRKKLVNNLIKVFETDKENLINVMQEAGISKNARAAEVTFEQWRKLYELK